MILIEHDPRPQQIFLYALVLLLAATVCIIALMYADYVLQLAKSKQVPNITVLNAEYVHVTNQELDIVGESGVTR